MSITLSHAEWQRINEIIIRMNRENDIWLALSDFLKDIEQLIPYDKADILLYSFSDDKYSVDKSMYRYFDASEERNYNEYYFQIDDVLDKMKQTQLYVMRSSDVFDSSREDTEYYIDHIKKTDIHYSLDANFKWHRNNKSINFGSLDLFRSKNSVDFSEKEKVICEIVQPHIETKISQFVYSDSDFMDGLLDPYGLTKMEAAVAKCVLRGYTNEMIASELYITVSTVKKHITNILNKTSTFNKADLISKLFIDHMK